jgi:hypothetical protein
MVLFISFLIFVLFAKFHYSALSTHEASIGVSHFPANGRGVAITHGSKRELSLCLVKDYDGLGQDISRHNDHLPQGNPVTHHPQSPSDRPKSISRKRLASRG